MRYFLPFGDFIETSGVLFGDFLETSGVLKKPGSMHKPNPFQPLAGWKLISHMIWVHHGNNYLLVAKKSMSG